MINAWIELILLIFNIVILAAIYSSIFLVLLFLIFRHNENSLVRKLSSQKIKLWLAMHLILSISFFYYRFTYARDTGLGENLTIPVGYGQTIENADGEMTYFFPDEQKAEHNTGEIYIENFMIRDGKVCARVSPEISVMSGNELLVWDLKTKTIKTFKNTGDYKMYAIENELPADDQFYSFQKHYQEYTENIPQWKKWLLP